MADQADESFYSDELIRILQDAVDTNVLVSRPPYTYRTDEIMSGLKALGLPSSRDIVLRKIGQWISEGKAVPTKAKHKNHWGELQTVKMIQFVMDDNIGGG